MRTKKAFGALLPATPCDLEMRMKMETRAAAMGVSLAEAQRNAFAVFLRRSDKSLNIKNQ